MPRLHPSACLSLLGLLFLLAAKPAHAGLIFAFDQSNYTVAAGGQVTIQVYLEQTSPTTILTDEGLFSAGVQVSFGPAATVARIADIIPNPAFDDVENISLTSNTVELAEAAFLNPTVYPAAGENRILLETLIFTAGTSSGISDLSAAILPGGLDETVSGLGTPLDGLIQDGAATIAVTATVPGPGSFTLMSSGFLTLVGFRSYRRRHAA